MENKKILIPIILGSALLLGIIFTLVYKKTSEDPFKESVVQTLAPKESETTIETKVQGDNSNSLEEFDINKIKPNETKVVYVDESGNILSEEDAKEIEEKDYSDQLLQDGMMTILRYGVACYKKRCMVQMMPLPEMTID